MRISKWFAKKKQKKCFLRLTKRTKIQFNRFKVIICMRICIYLYIWSVLIFSHLAIIWDHGVTVCKSNKTEKDRRRGLLLSSCAVFFFCCLYTQWSSLSALLVYMRGLMHWFSLLLWNCCWCRAIVTSSNVPVTLYQSTRANQIYCSRRLKSIYICLRLAVIYCNFLYICHNIRFTYVKLYHNLLKLLVTIFIGFNDAGDLCE